MSLRMIQLSVVPARLYAWAREAGMTLEDRGYLAHMALRKAFGEAAPQPFVVLEPKPGARRLTVLGYATASKDELARLLAMHAQPLLAEALPADSLADKPMPEHWPAGQRLGFRVRCCPVVRKPHAGEKDAFLAACDHAPQEELDREAVYLGWLERELSREDAAGLETGSMRGFQLVKPVRRRQAGQRATRMPGQRPDVVLEGVLQVRDAAGFGKLLARGVGRHRAFGYGMLLLSPARG